MSQGEQRASPFAEIIPSGLIFCKMLIRLYVRGGLILLGEILLLRVH